MNIDKIENFFEKLYNENTKLNSEDFLVLVSKINNYEGHVLFSIDGQNKRHILIEYLEDDKIEEDKKSRGVQLNKHIVKNKEDTKTTKYIDIECKLKNLEDLFSYFIKELFDEIENNKENLNRICIRVLNKWREFFRKKYKPKLSKKEIIGLYGELWYLKKILRKNKSAINYWTGPEGSRFDIQSGNIAFEVKCTEKKKGRFYNINGIHQLEKPKNSDLYLGTLLIEDVPENGYSLNDLVNEISQLVIDPQELYIRLAKVGYFPSKRDLYEKYRFRPFEREERIYKVDRSFPKIIPSSFLAGKLPSGVFDLKYVIDLNSEPPLPLNEEEKEEFFDKFSKN